MVPVPDPGAGEREMRSAVARAVRAFQRGDDRERSFELVYRYYQPRMERALRRLVFSPDERRDVIQESAMRIYQGLEGLREVESLDRWVFTILHNCYLHWLSAQPGAKKTLKMIPLETTAAGDPGPPPAVGGGARPAETSPLDEAIRRERGARLRAAVARLTPQRRRCVELRVYQDRDVKEVALALRLAEGTVKAHLHHAREQLRQELADDFESIEF